MNLLRVRLNYDDILTFTMRPCFITVVVRSMLYHIRRLSIIKWLSCCNGQQGIRGQRNHSQKHNAYLSHAHEEISQIY